MLMRPRHWRKKGIELVFFPRLVFAGARSSLRLLVDYNENEADETRQQRMTSACSQILRNNFRLPPQLTS